MRFARTGTLVASLERDIVEQLTIERGQHRAAPVPDDSTAQLVAGLVQLVGMHDPQAAARFDEIAAFALRIAHELRLSQAQIGTVELAARLHDIGYVGVRSEILAKPAALTSQELAEVRGHVELGSTLLGDLPALAHIAPIVRAHHERWDGRGYPDRLRGDEIPLESRIIAVADAVAAMTSPRPYRPALALGDALAVVAQNAGTQFDADVVRAASAIFRGAQGGYREIA
jgi:HD-GYP domain-containing protein (c-di-GMP phosphodiesterase class II)